MAKYFPYPSLVCYVPNYEYLIGYLLNESSSRLAKEGFPCI